MKIGILLSGCGVYDGAEIQEAVLSMLAIQELGSEYVCISVNENQLHVLNHLTGEEMNETRNMMVEAGRIARGAVLDINSPESLDIGALVIPGGFGSAKNFSTWAFEGPDGSISASVKTFLLKLRSANKPIAALCVSPIVLAKAFEGSEYHLNMTIGTDKEVSQYYINEFSQVLQKTGATTEMKSIQEILVDKKNKIVTAPCYMMDVSILEIRKNIHQAISAVIELSNNDA